MFLDTQGLAVRRNAPRLAQAGASQVALLGKSLGGAVAIYLAAARHEALQAVIVENTFTSLEEMAPKVRASRCKYDCKPLWVCHAVWSPNLR